MRWEMETEEIEAAMERIWDLHDKVSDAIHSVSRARFFHSIRTGGGGGGGGGRTSSVGKSLRAVGGWGENGGGGLVFVKGLVEEDEEGMVAEARSLHLIRTALENLEDQLEFLHSVQSQWQTERDAAIARLEQSRIILATRLADHHGKKYKVIEEALAFVGDVHDTRRFVAPKELFGRPTEVHNSRRPNIFRRLLMSGMILANKLLKLGTAGGVVGNTTVFAISLLAVFQLHQLASRGGLLLEVSPMQQQFSTKKRVGNITSKMNWNSQSEEVKHLDVFSARG